MCGRYTLTKDLSLFLQQFGIQVPNYEHYPRYNIAPGQQIFAVVADPEPRLERFEWGFLPGWAKPDTAPVINARSEGMESKPYFKTAFIRQRCAIIADSFYEWTGSKGGKQPHRIMMKDGQLFAMAGLWSAPLGHPSTAAIITTEANRLIAELHHRMPVILNIPDLMIWLDPQTSVKDLLAILNPYPEEEMQTYAVSPIVNKSGADDPAMVERLQEFPWGT